MKTILIIIGIVLLVGIIVYFFKSDIKDYFTVIQHDTTIATRYYETIKRDTVIKWYEKIQWKQAKADTVYWDRVDSVFIEKVKDQDVMLRVEKKGNTLNIYAVNINGKILKQYKYDWIGDNFTAVSQDSNIFVKSQNWYWDRFNLFTEFNLPLHKGMKLIDTYPELGITTGINFRGVLDLQGGFKYDVSRSETKAILKLNYQF